MAGWREVCQPVEIKDIRSSARVEIRSEYETQLIAMAALECARGDVKAARRLILKTTFRYFGQTWGESLFLADGGSKLPPVEEVIGTLALVSEVDPVDWEQEVAVHSAQKMAFRPVDLPLYMTQIADLAGDQALASFVETSRYQDIFLPGDSVLAVAKVLYREIAGLSYWEMEAIRPVLFLLDYYLTWKQMGALLDSSPKRMEDGLSSIITDSRSCLRRLARVVLGRGLIQPGKFIEASNGTRLTYDEVIRFLD